jgi:hypothetical protein
MWQQFNSLANMTKVWASQILAFWVRSLLNTLMIKFSLGNSYGEFNYNKYQNILMVGSKEKQKIIYSKNDER